MIVNIGMIGLGRIGKLHAEHLSLRVPEARVASIAEIKKQIDSVDSARNFTERLRIPKITEDYHEILSDRKIDAVVISTPSDSHSRIITEAAEAGKHIFCEKPIDRNLAKVHEALEAVEKAGVKFQVGFNRRFDPTFAQVKKNIREGRVGKPHLIHIISRDPAPPPLEYIKASGGLFVDMTIHDFDMARFLIGSEVEELFAYGGVMVDPDIGAAEDIDTALITLKFEDGVLGTIDNSRKAAYGYDQRVEVFGSAGSISTENITPHRTVISNSEGAHTPNPLNFFMERYIESYVREIRAFIGAIVNDTQTQVSGADGKAPIVMAMAARKSYEEKRVVRLSEITKR